MIRSLAVREAFGIHSVLPGVLTLVASGLPAQVQTSPVALGRDAVVERALAPGAAHDYTVRLGRGTSVVIAVEQIGVDVVVELRDPDGTLLEVVDSPTGRAGEEQAEILAERAGVFAVRVRPYATDEPEGRYRLRVAEWRDARATAELLAARARARDSAVAWLRRRGAPLRIRPAEAIPPLDEAVRGARVVGLGEATHGSRELADLRLAITQYLIQRHGFRMIAIENSVSRLALLDQWALGAPVDDDTVRRTLDSGWIGRRTLDDLTRWVRDWNATRPQDPVRLVGLDPQDNALARALLRDVLLRGYGEDAVTRFAGAIQEIAAADSQALVFGNSRVAAEAHAALLEVVARLAADAPLLTRRLGEAAVDAARDAAMQLMQSADFNVGGAAGGRSRDWYMAANLVRALDAAPDGMRAVFWAHNAHVAADPSLTFRTSGALLREALGCGYRALATSFGEGAFVAQVPGDPQARLEVSVLPPAPLESIDAVMGSTYGGAAISVWECGTQAADAPSWLRTPQPLHWVGGIYDPASAPSSVFTPFRLLEAFDGIMYLPRVTADEIFHDRPAVRSRSGPGS